MGRSWILSVLTVETTYELDHITLKDLIRWTAAKEGCQSASRYHTGQKTILIHTTGPGW